MDIWRWVSTTKRALRRDGNERLAELMQRIPSLVCDDEHARVEALVPEALALARAAKLPWVEVFVRHWLLQSRVFHRHDVSRSLGEAVSLLDFASRDEARGCPQSVCVTQDLAGCYGQIDGPGYVAERLAVARETLARIDPSWPCYTCITGEYVDALSDDGREEEALEFIRAQVAAAAAVGRDVTEDLCHSEVHALIRLRRFDEALARLVGYEHAAGGESNALETRLLRAWALTGLDRFAEAQAELPPFEGIVDTPDRYESWMNATLGLVRGGLVADDRALGRQLRTMATRLEENGALYGACEVAIAAAEAAARRGAWRIAAASLDDAARLARELRRPPTLPDLRPPADLAAVDVGDLDDFLADLVDAEDALDVVVAAREVHPEDAGLAVAEARGLGAAGYAAHALRGLAAFVDAHPDAEEAVVGVVRLHLEVGDPAAALEVIRARLLPRPETRARGLWLLAGAHEAAGEVDLAAEALRAVVELVPDADPPLARLADLLRGRQRFAEAAAVRRVLTARLPPGPHDWDLMSEATIAGEWAWVRESAARMGLPLGTDEDGPTDYAFGICELVFDEGGGTTLWAERRGPVSARVISIAGPGARERYGDLVVFDAADLRPRDDDEEGEREPPRFRVLATIEDAETRSFALDGPHPGEEGVAALRELLHELGGQLSVRSGDGYELGDSEADDPDAAPHRGLYAFIAVPPAVDLIALEARLRAIVDRFDLPLAWIELASALPPGAAREAALARSQGIVDRFDL